MTSHLDERGITLPPPFELEVDGYPAFVVLPERRRDDGPLEWVWYAPTFRSCPPNARHQYIVDRVLGAGMAFAGIDVGESAGNPEGRALFTAFHRTVTSECGLARQATLLAQSRGGLFHYNWASEHPDLVRRIGGIYPVCDLCAWPGLALAAPTYGLSERDLAAALDEHNPVERLAPLAEAKVPILHIHGDVDDLVPLEDHSGELVQRYRRLGGNAEVIVIEGRGHEEVDELFMSERFAAFLTSGESGPP